MKADYLDCVLPDLDFTRPPRDLEVKPAVTASAAAAELRARLKARRRARRINMNHEAVVQLRNNIHKWGWFPAVRHAAKNGVPIEFAIAARAMGKK